MKNIIAVIPARYNSSRLPGKPLLKFGEYTMIQRVYLQTIKSKYIDKVYVTTDDERVKKNVELVGGNVIMINDECLNGTERIYLALQKLEKEEDIRDINIIVNVQGDEPYINPDNIILSDWLNCSSTFFFCLLNIVFELIQLAYSDAEI